MTETPKQRKIPMRKCSGCAGHFPKGELLRMVRTPDGEIVLDEKGKVSGRGVYLCHNATCLKKARKTRRLEVALACAIPDSIYDRLEELAIGKE